MKRRASRSRPPPVSPAGPGTAPQGVLLAVPTVTSLRDAELVLPPEAEGPVGEGEAHQPSQLQGGVVPGP